MCPGVVEVYRDWNPRPDGVLNGLVRLEEGWDWTACQAQRFEDHTAVDLRHLSSAPLSIL